MLEALKYALGTAVLVVTWLFGPFDILLQVLISFIMLDYLTGVIRSIKEKKVSSELGFNGIIKKTVTLAMVAVSGMLDKLMPESNGALRAAVTCFYIANEGISILENASMLGLPLPAPLIAVLHQIRSKGTDTPDSEEESESPAQIEAPKEDKPHSGIDEREDLYD